MLNRTKLRQVRRREGRYLLRTNMPEATPSGLWSFYIQLTEVQAAFRTLKDDLNLRPPTTNSTPALKLTSLSRSWRIAFTPGKPFQLRKSG